MYTSTETTKKEMARFWTRDEWRSIRVLNSYFFGIAREKEMAVHTHPAVFLLLFRPLQAFGAKRERTDGARYETSNPK